MASELVKPLKILKLSDKIKETEMLMKQMSVSKPEYFCKIPLKLQIKM